MLNERSGKHGICVFPIQHAVLLEKQSLRKVSAGCPIKDTNSAGSTQINQFSLGQERSLDRCGLRGGWAYINTQPYPYKYLQKGCCLASIP